MRQKEVEENKPPCDTGEIYGKSNRTDTTLDEKEKADDSTTATNTASTSQMGETRTSSNIAESTGTETPTANTTAAKLTKQEQQIKQQ